MSLSVQAIVRERMERLCACGPTIIYHLIFACIPLRALMFCQFLNLSSNFGRDSKSKGPSGNSTVQLIATLVLALVRVSKQVKILAHVKITTFGIISLMQTQYWPDLCRLLQLGLSFTPCRYSRRLDPQTTLTSWK